jgi:arginine/lysine/ornithine decarboxylase
MLLLVDEAHGAHLAAAPDLLPPTALACGADACVQSAHKTLPALTQGAFLHLAPAKAADEEAVSRLNAAVRIFQTSSPSFAIAASLDLARAWLEQSGHGLIERLLTQIDRLATRLEPDFLVTPATRDLATAGPGSDAPCSAPSRLARPDSCRAGGVPQQLGIDGKWRI